MAVRYLKATEIPMAVRKPHLDRYQRQLRDALLNPGLSDDHKVLLKDRLATLGHEKPYAVLAQRRAAKGVGAVEAAKQERDSSGAVTVAPASPSMVEEGADSLLVRTKDELIALATEKGVEVKPSWTKAKIAEAILARRAGA